MTKSQPQQGSFSGSESWPTRERLTSRTSERDWSRCEVTGAAESDPSLFSPTPPPEALTCLISLASADRRRVLDFADTRTAHDSGTPTARSRRRVGNPLMIPLRNEGRGGVLRGVHRRSSESGVCVCLCVWVCMYKCVRIWYLVAAPSLVSHLNITLAISELPLLQTGFSPYFDAFLRRHGNRQARELVLNWIGTATRSRIAEDSACRHEAFHESVDHN